MREIKFRAWDSYQKIMCQWNEIGELDQAMNLSIWNALNGFVAHITIMQYTGLKDKNGKEIYEGDIAVYTPFGHRNILVKGIIQWDIGGTYVIYTNFKDVETSPYIFYCQNMEIIGNIYENGDLLNGK